MHWARAALLLCASLAACRFTVPAVATDAGGGGIQDMAVAVDLGGDVAGGCACALGCVPAPTPHCLALQPSGPVTTGDFMQSGLTGLNVGGNISLNTDDGSITGIVMRPPGAGVNMGIGYRVATQTGGPSVGVFSFDGFLLPAGARMTVRGSNAFALASTGPVQIDGTIDAACSVSGPGPGGSRGGTMAGAASGDGSGSGAGKAGQTGATGGSGGGGAGYGDSGGAGGLLVTQTARNGGAIWGDLTTPALMLVGGSGGGAGAGPMGGVGGAGGGAVQLSVNNALRVGGVIHVGGCGGAKGSKNNGGGGGGSGGAIVLEAGSITLSASAVLAANGGGGGAGDDKSSSGSDGTASTAPAPGGTTTSNGGGNGGNGGASNGMPGQHFTSGRDGQIPTAGMSFGGGGGGGAGRIALRAMMTGISDGSTAVTPDAADTNSAGQHPTVYGVATFQ